MDTIITFGETMLRLSPADSGERLSQASSFRVEPGGSESNVAIALAALGHSVRHVTRLPDNPLGELVARQLRKYGVDVTGIERSPHRVGCYWTEIGVGPRASRVIYDRADSGFATWTAAEIDWQAVFSGADRFHCSGITLGLSESARDALIAGLERTPSGMRVSIDLNFRKALWGNVTEDAQEKLWDCYAKCCERCDVILGNETDFEDALGLRAGDGKEAVDRYTPVAEALFERFERTRTVGVSLRRSASATENGWSGLLFQRTAAGLESYRGAEYELDAIVDRVGSGDSFAAGILHGLTTYPDDSQRTLDFAVTFSALKHTVRGDAGPFSEDEVWQTFRTGGSGRILR